MVRTILTRALVCLSLLLTAGSLSADTTLSGPMKFGSGMTVTGNRVAMRQFDPVVDHGAATDGTTDASAAIALSLADCAAAGGGQINIGDYRMRVSASLTVPFNCALRGNFWMGNQGNEPATISRRPALLLDPTPLAITAASWAAAGGGKVTFTTTTAHGLSVGTPFAVSGMTPTDYNQSYVAITGTTGSTLVAAKKDDPSAATVMGNISETIQVLGTLENLAIYRYGLTVPTTVREAVDQSKLFAGTAVSVLSKGVSLNNLLIVGFDKCVDASGGENNARLRMTYIFGDCTNGVLIDEIHDLVVVHDVELLGGFWVGAGMHYDTFYPTSITDDGTGAIKLTFPAQTTFKNGDRLQVRNEPGFTGLNAAWTAQAVSTVAPWTAVLQGSKIAPVTNGTFADKSRWIQVASTKGLGIGQQVTGTGILTESGTPPTPVTVTLLNIDWMQKAIWISHPTTAAGTDSPLTFTNRYRVPGSGTPGTILTGAASFVGHTPGCPPPPWNASTHPANCFYSYTDGVRLDASFRDGVGFEVKDSEGGMYRNVFAYGHRTGFRLITPEGAPGSDGPGNITMFYANCDGGGTVDDTVCLLIEGSGSVNWYGGFMSQYANHVYINGGGVHRLDGINRGGGNVSRLNGTSHISVNRGKVLVTGNTVAIGRGDTIPLFISDTAPFSPVQIEGGDYGALKLLPKNALAAGRLCTSDSAKIDVEAGARFGTGCNKPLTFTSGNQPNTFPVYLNPGPPSIGTFESPGVPTTVGSNTGWYNATGRLMTLKGLTVNVGTAPGTLASGKSWVATVMYGVIGGGLNNQGPSCTITDLAKSCSTSFNATFRGKIDNTLGAAGTTLTVTDLITGTISPGQLLGSAVVAEGTTIISQTGGTTGAEGTYTVSLSQLVPDDVTIRAIPPTEDTAEVGADSHINIRMVPINAPAATGNIVASTSYN